MDLKFVRRSLYPLSWRRFRVWISLLFFLKITFNPTLGLGSGPISMIYRGQLTGIDGKAMNSPVNILFQIYSPDKSCLLYEEKNSGLDLSSTEGHFSLAIGATSANRTSQDQSLNLVDIFRNDSISILSSGTPNCANGYTPASGDIRYLRVIVEDGNGNIDVLTPDEPINSIPFAMVADSLQGIDKNKILQENVMGSIQLNQANLESLFTTPGFTNIQTVLNGNFISSAGKGVPLPAFSTNPSGATAGSIWFDSVSSQLKYWDGASVKTLSTLTGGLTSLNGQSGSLQTFSDDTNVTMSSNSNNHSLGWNGQLSLGRGGTGANLTAVSGGAVYSTGAGLGITSAGSPGQFLMSQGSGAPIWQTPTDGTVTSVSLSMPSGIFGVTGSPVTVSGSIGVSLNTQNANLVLAGPTTGSATPSFRNLTIGDIKSTISGSFLTGASSCGSGEALTWSSVSDTIACTSLHIDSGLSGTLPLTNGGTGSTNGSITGSGSLTFATGGVNLGLLLSTTGTGSVQITNNLASGNSSSGALIVAGGVGIGESLNVNGSIHSDAAIVSKTYDNSASAIISFATGNNQISSTAATNILLCGMQDGGSYSLILSGEASNTLISLTANGQTNSSCTAGGSPAPIPVDFGGSSIGYTNSFLTSNNTSVISFMYSASRGVIYANGMTGFYH